MVVLCPICHSFAATDLKGIIRHLGVIHAHESGFYVRCFVDDCPSTYRNFHSYKKHLYTKHRAVLEVPPISADINVTDNNTPTDEISCRIDDPDDSISSRIDEGRSAALFVLKAKQVHKVSQCVLTNILFDYSEMHENNIREICEKVMVTLDGFFQGSTPETLKISMGEIFASPQASNPFHGLETRQKQITAFYKHFNIIVR